MDEYLGRIYDYPSRSIPAGATVCVPAVCSAEVVGRYVFPEFNLPGFDVGNVTAWPALNKEVLPTPTPF